MDFKKFKQGDEIIYIEPDSITGADVQVADIVFYATDAQLVTRNGKVLTPSNNGKVYPTGRHQESFIATDKARQVVNSIRRVKVIPNPESEPE